MNGVVWSKLEMHPSLKQCAATESPSLAVTLPLKSHDDKSSRLKSHWKLFTGKCTSFKFSQLNFFKKINNYVDQVKLGFGQDLASWLAVHNKL